MPRSFNDDESTTAFEVRLDDLTMARLLEIAESGKIPPAMLIASIVADVLEDDALAHPDGDVDTEAETVVRPSANKDLH